MSDTAKTGYEIRRLLLHLAKDILNGQAQFEMAKSQGKSGVAPTTEDVLREAEKLYAFVQKK